MNRKMKYKVTAILPVLIFMIFILGYSGNIPDQDNQNSAPSLSPKMAKATDADYELSDDIGKYFPGIEEELGRFSTLPALQHASWGFIMMDAESGEILAARDPYRSLIPASTVKLFTTATALALLGPDFRFTTELQYDGEIDHHTGILHGNIYIRGGGDPTLGSTKIEGSKNLKDLLDSWEAAILKLGIREVNGAIIADAGFFEDEVAPSSWTYGDMGNYYGAAASGLTIIDNTFNIFFRSGKREGDPTTVVRTLPEIDHVELYNHVRTGAFGTWDNAYVHGSPLSNIYVLKGTVPPNQNAFGIRAALPDPALFAAEKLHERLDQIAFPVSEAPTTARISRIIQNERTTFHTHLSPPLSRIVIRINEASDNLYAEHLLKMIGKKVANEGSTEAGVKEVRKFLEKNEINLGGVSIYDGSGLSRRNTVTPMAMAQLLYHVKNNNGEIFEDFYSSLAVAGKTGTFRHFGNGTSIEGNLTGKSGTLGRVRTYAGYLTTSAEREVIYVMFANNFTSSGIAMRDNWVKLMVAMSESEEKKGRGWQIRN